MYDGFGNRVSKTANGVTTKYLVEDDVNPTGLPQVFDELTGSTGTRTYTYGLQRISENQVIDNVWTPSFYGYDGFGTVRQLTNTGGAVTDTFEYDAFGNAITQTGTMPNNYLYRGEQYDPDLGLYYLRARYYNPLSGRFMSRDPEDGDPTIPATLHKYIYAAGDPVNASDPMGSEVLITYTSFAQNRARAAIAFGVKSDICLLHALNSIGSALTAPAEQQGAGSDQNVGTQLGGCERNAIKGLLGILLSHVTP